MSRVEASGQLDAKILQSALQDRRIGHRILFLTETTSTNDVVAQMAPANSEGLVVFAETQTAARGQYGRRWESAAHHGLWLSVLLRPKIAVKESARLTDLLARVIATTVQTEIGLVCTIKPPNDIYCASRKLAGVLVEMRVEANGDYAAIAGLGINVNQTPDDFPLELRKTAGSLAMLIDRRVNRTSLAVALLQELDARYADFSGSNR